jgi:hypothetical protein
LSADGAAGAHHARAWGARSRLWLPAATKYRTSGIVA